MLAARIVFTIVIVAVAAYSYVRFGLCAEEHNKTWRLCRAVQGLIVLGTSAVVAGGAAVSVP